MMEVLGRMIFSTVSGGAIVWFLCVSVGNVDHVEGLVGILGCGVFSLLVKYLYLLLGACYEK
jgi:hypothetical protein